MKSESSCDLLIPSFVLIFLLAVLWRKYQRKKEVDNEETMRKEKGRNICLEGMRMLFIL